MNVSKAQALAYLYPHAEPDVDFEARDDGDGREYIARWDEAKLDPPPTEAEIASAELPILRAVKTDEMARAAIDDLSRLFTPGKGRDETALLVASHVLRICEALGIQPDPRLVEVVQVGEKALQKKAAVEQAATPEEVDAIEWT